MSFIEEFVIITLFRFHIFYSVPEQYLHSLPGFLRQLWDSPAGVALPFVSLSAVSARPNSHTVSVLLALTALPVLHALPTLISFPAIFPFFHHHLLMCEKALNIYNWLLLLVSSLSSFNCAWCSSTS